MKRLLLVLQAFVLTLAVSAQLNGDGYYRIKNVGSERYVTVRDNRGGIDIGSASAEMGAVELYKGFDNVVSDPSSILYIDETTSGYKFYSQGTDTYEIIGYYLLIKKNSDGSYKAYQGNSMVVLCLGDGVTTSGVTGKMSTNAKGNYRDWYILPVTSTSKDNYFGVKPEVKAADGHYASFYASFPFTVASAGMKVYYIDKADYGMAVYKEVTDGVVPGAAPVFVKCVSDVPADNKLDIAANSATLSDNKLSGVYFNNDNAAHLNRKEYDPETMRVLGTDADGKLAYVKADYDYLPANRSYLTVSAGSPDVIKIVTEEEYQKALQDMKKDFTVTFMVDGEVISSQTLRMGDPIQVPDAPEKEGHTFNGWGDVPATMPARDLTFEGTYTVNSYTVIIKLNEQTVFSEKMPYGTPIDVTAYEKEGHTIRWNNLHETVPAYNVTIRGVYVPNTYALQYVVDGKNYQKKTVEYGAPISLIAHPTKEGRTFSGWSEVPETMPAENVVVTGCFMYKVFYYVNGELVHTAEAFYGSEMPEYEYQPTEEGVTFLGWNGETYETMPAKDVTYTANLKGSGVDMLVSDALVDVYTITGTRVMSSVSLDDAKRFLKRGIYIVNGKKMIVE